MILLQDVNLTAERELLLLKALMKFIKFVCLISILNIASICGFLLLFVPYDAIDSRVSMKAMSPLWFYIEKKHLATLFYLQRK